jgi:Tol biopolymer transport system component
VAAARIDPHTGTSDIWIIDAARGNERRLTFDTSWETYPLWSRDSSSIVFASDRRGRWEMYKKASSGDGPDQRLLPSGLSVFPSDWRSDGRLLFRQWDPNQKTKGDFSLLAPGDDAKPVRLPDLESDEQSGRISPDGRWLAYEGWESAWSVYVRPLQSTESRWQVSPIGGAEPRWRADGRELFFLSPDLSVMAMDIEPVDTFRVVPARRLFQTQAVAPSGLVGQAYDVTSDGQRFLVKVPASFSPITVVVNWTSLFQNRR